MQRNASALAVSLVVVPLLLAGCGALTTAPATSPPAQPAPVHAATLTAARLMRPMSPLPPPVPSLFVVEGPSGNDYTLRIIDTAGATLASAPVSAAAEWSTAAGPGGAYWIEGGHVNLLTPSGARRVLSDVPGNTNGLLISPDGTAFAYTTSTGPDASNVIHNRIVVQAFGSAARVVADRMSDPAHPSADAPTSWTYMLQSWTRQGILFIRDAYGGCGCGPFDMEMQAAYTALIDPVTSGTTDLTADGTCPLSGVGPYQTAACFHGGMAVDELRIANAGTVTARYSMSARNAAGDARFSPDGSAVAYVTVASTSNFCGSDYQATLHVLSSSTGLRHGRWSESTPGPSPCAPSGPGLPVPISWVSPRPLGARSRLQAIMAADEHHRSVGPVGRSHRTRPASGPGVAARNRGCSALSRSLAGARRQVRHP
jgi:hypothetical protein